jgi:ABC-type nitrate/sulfonate/bicarbonate transport system permease component
MKKYTSIAHKLLPLAGLLMLLIIWELVVRINNIPLWLLPAPSQVLITITDIWGLLAYHTQITLLEAGYGFMLSIVLSLAIAMVMDNLSVIKLTVYPLLVVSQTIPLVVLAVLLPLWFGWGMAPKVLIVVLVCFFPIVISLIKGLDSVDADKINLFKSMGAGNFYTFRIVKFPAALPTFFSGLKISASYSIMAAVISEWVGAQRGLGYFMTIQQKNFAIDKVLAAVVIICLLSLLLVKLVDFIEYVIMPWNRNKIESFNN